MNTFAKTLSVLTLTIATFAIACSANAEPSKLFGKDFQMTRISGNSMLPTLQSGETAIVFKAYPFQKLRVGDVVIIESERGYSVIHRVVRRSRGRTWVTQGDNNRHEDRGILTSDNFGGLALVDDSMARYQQYVASVNPVEQHAELTMVAQADVKSETRMDRLRNL